jgi:ABC-type Fe3+-hydroxamate transport system substrate-binding protein
VRLAALPGWRELTAVRSGRAYAVDAAVFNRPGPNVARVAEMLAGMFHPRTAPAR